MYAWEKLIDRKTKLMTLNNLTWKKKNKIKHNLNISLKTLDSLKCYPYSFFTLLLSYTLSVRYILTGTTSGIYRAMVGETTAKVGTPIGSWWRLDLDGERLTTTFLTDGPNFAQGWMKGPARTKTNKGSRSRARGGSVNQICYHAFTMI